MNFASFPYLVFLGLSVLIYFQLNEKWRNVFLLFCSYFFYSIFGLGFAALMLITTSITFIASRYCYAAKNDFYRKLFFYSGLLFDLGILILFKYVYIIDIDLMNWPNWSGQKFLIPIGISFYTFKTVGYCIDIYKRKYEPETSFIYYALSVSFFPQLIAGPIEKSINISAGFKKITGFNLYNFFEGGKLILWGLFKKLVIADGIARIINPFYQDVTNYKGLDLVVMSVAFIYQIYADFSGYSDIAIGSAKCFGIHLPPNFNKPFFSKNFRNFWGRWHISFSVWLKEYVFNLMGGVSRTSKVRTVLNLTVVFFIVGFWHGATPNYLLYSLLALLWLLLDIATKQLRQKIFKTLNIKKNSILMSVMCYFAVITMFSTLTFFFKPNSLSDSLYIIQNIGYPHFYKISLINVGFIMGLILFLEGLQYFQLSAIGHCFQGIKNFYSRLLFYIIIFFAIILVSSRPDLTFQYFQF